MSLRAFLIFMSIVTAACWAAWAIVVAKIDPGTSGFIGHVAFYASLFLALVGTFGLLGLGVRMTFKKNIIAFRHMSPSIRQAFLFSLLLVSALLLQGQRLLTWYAIVFLILGLTILEFFFSARENR